jgi:hypothetical protein
MPIGGEMNVVLREIVPRRAIAFHGTLEDFPRIE